MNIIFDFLAKLYKDNISYHLEKFLVFLISNVYFASFKSSHDWFGEYAYKCMTRDIYFMINETLIYYSLDVHNHGKSKHILVRMKPQRFWFVF